jgi:ribonuclease J
MTRLTVYGGAGTVGGNQALVEDARGAFFFDFGTPHGLRGRYYEEFLRPRPGAGVLDALTLGLLPPVEGIYRPDLEADAERLWARFRGAPGYKRLERVDGVLISHAHLDHCGYVSFLREDIPIYGSLMTSIIMKAMQDSSATDFERELVYTSPRHANEEGYLATERGQRRQRAFTFLLTQNDSATPPGQAVEPFPEVYAFWGALPRSPRTELQTVRPGVLPQFSDRGLNGRGLRHYPIDHSILGATGYAVETSDGWVVYTGDIRFHGAQPGLTREFIDGVAALRPLALICEGTHTEPGVASATEQDVYGNALRAVQGERGIVIADFGTRNMERLLTFNGVAEFSNRRLVLTARDAYLLESMGNAWRQFPPLDEVPTFAVYDEARGQRQGWEEGIRERYRSMLVGPEEISANPGGYILCFSYWDFKNLIDIAPQGGLYIYSGAEVYAEEDGFDVDRLRAWLDRFGMRALGLPHRVEGEPFRWTMRAEDRGVHSSGHASYDEMLRFIREVRPKHLVPVHTERPEAFARDLKGEGISVAAPTRGETFLLA